MTKCTVLNTSTVGRISSLLAKEQAIHELLMWGGILEALHRAELNGATENVAPGKCRTWKMTDQTVGLANAEMHANDLVFHFLALSLNPSFSRFCISSPAIWSIIHTYIHISLFTNNTVT